MCWSVEASAAFVAVGSAATVVTYRRQMGAPIWATLAYFTVMEGLQVAGYAVIDACGTPANRTVTMLSYLHIVFQPIFINLFAMELVPAPVKQRMRRWMMACAGASAVVMVLQVLPVPGTGLCVPGTSLCGEAWCTVTGTWHIAWQVPYNGLLVPLDQALGVRSGFPTYMATVFLLPLLYGAWRFVLMHVLLGPVLAWGMTGNPNEMPAIWCFFSIMILLIALSPAVRRTVSAETWWGVRAS